jgi:DivIVA domain-containing protein
MLNKKDIDEKKFESSFRGYSKEEVDDFLDEVSASVGEMTAAFVTLEKKYESLKAKYAELEKNHSDSCGDESAAPAAAAVTVKAETEVRAEPGDRTDIARAKALAVQMLKKAREESAAEARRSKFESEKAIAAAKREAMLITDKAKQSTQSLKTAAKESAEKMLADAKRESDALLRDAKLKSEETVLRAETSAQVQREMFMKLREDILSLAGEFSENIGSKLDEINSLARRAGEMEFGETEDMHEEADAELMSGINGSGFTPAPDTELAADGEEDGENAGDSEGSAEDGAEESDTEDTDAHKKVNDDSAESTDSVEAEDDDTYSDADDDTYDYEPSDKTASSSRQVKDSDLDKIFSFDIDEIMNDGK